MQKTYDYYREAEYQDWYERMAEERERYNEEMEQDRLGLYEKETKKEKICKPQLQLQK